MSRSLELISHPLCPFVHRAAALLTELGVPFTQRFVDLSAKPDWFVKLSPRGKVPVLVADGAAIFESNVILEYLAETVAPQLVLEEPLQRARRRMWMEIANDLLMGQYKISVAATPDTRSQAVAAAKETLARFELVLTARFFAGDEPGLVDFAAGPALVRFEKLNRELGLDLYVDLPRVAAWSKAIYERPAFRDTIVADFDERFRALLAHHDVAA
jgi:glutathione S-transferase